MTEQDYVKDRLQNQISWYEAKSARNKKWFHLFQLITILSASVVTLTGAFNLESHGLLKYLAPTLGAVISVVSGLTGMYKFQEKWVEYRTTTESLKHEKYLFITKSEPYNQDNAFNLLVGRVEILISKENSQWSEYISSNTTEE